MGIKAGKFVISLDFEIMWGVRDVLTKEQYGENLIGVQQAIPLLLEYFKKYSIKGTFATVGMLFFKTKEELLNNLPGSIPVYKNSNLSPYGSYLEKKVGADLSADLYHFAPHLVQFIQDTPGQEISTHTFSHFYCLEPGQTLQNFEDDINAAIRIAKKRGISITSIILPRNQVNEGYLQVCKNLGITNYRSNENSWIYKARSYEKESSWRRICRLLDAYINITGQHCYSEEFMKKGIMINIPSSRFLRPYIPSLSWLEGLRLRRIKNSMTYAAKHGLLYHLWWHPHNFGINQEQNFSFLEKVLQHYTGLNKMYGFKSYTMSEVAEGIIN